MLTENDRTFKEWAGVCEAMKSGRQIVLLRKGGIREDDGVFRIADLEFFLLPTYEHQDPALVQPAFADEIARSRSAGWDPRTVTLDAYATVDSIRTTDDEERIRALAHEFIWNEQYIRMRLDFNPYDPLFVLILRVYRLPEPVCLPMRPAYAGCKSWVTLDQSISTAGLSPCIGDEEFAERRHAILETLQG